MMKVHPASLNTSDYSPHALAEEDPSARNRRGPTGIVNSTEAQWKRRVNQSFSRAASSYHDHADVQRQVVNRLVAKIDALQLASVEQVLEVGCGTGLLTQALDQRLPRARWLITDISEAMLDACRVQLPEARRKRFACMDGEWLASAATFDLVCSSLAVQWFAQPRQSLPRLAQLVRPGATSRWRPWWTGPFASGKRLISLSGCR
jgi:malonyl-CoA O-methyltransferase